MRRWLGARPLEDDVQRILTWIRAEAGGLTHNILSATHTDTISGAVAQGDLMVGESTPRWNRLALGADTYVLRSDGTDAVWADPTLWVPIAPVAQNDLIIADATPAWSILTGPVAQYERLESGAGAFVPAWTLNLGMADDAYIGIPGGGQVIFDSTPNPDQVQLAAADLYLPASHGIIHADGVTAGYVLRADGTRYIPADPTTTLPIAPVAQGDLIIADATPAWSILTLGAAAGYALVSTATTAEWDQTPTWTGGHTWDDGAGNSPALTLVGGSNDDTAQIFLDDDAVAGNSDLKVQLCAADADSRLMVQASTPANVAYIDAAGNAWFNTNVAIGAAVHASYRLRVEDATTTFAAADYYGIRNYHKKTAGASGIADDFYGLWNRVDLNQAAANIGNMYGIFGQARMDAGDVGDVGNSKFVYGMRFTCDLNAGKVWGYARALDLYIDQEAAHEVTGNLMGQIIWLDADGTVGGDVFLLRLQGVSNVDYGVYQDGATSNYFESDTSIGGTVGPLAQLHVDQSAAGGAQPALLLDQGDISEQCIQFSSDSADRDINLYTIDVTGTPTMTWDESEDDLDWNKNLILSAGDLKLASALGIIHADGVAAGYVLRADGTRYVPADPTVTLPLAPVAQGDLIIADGTPAWSILTVGAAAGYALVSTATTAEWDQTPSWTGKHTFTAASAIEIDVASGDPVIIFDTQGADKFTIGVDDDDSDIFKISGGGTLGASDWISIAADGDAGFRCNSAAANVEIEDGGTGNTVLLKITQDDNNTQAIVIGNDTASATDTHGLGLMCRQSGAGYIWAHSAAAENLLLQPAGYATGNVGIGISDSGTAAGRLHIVNTVAQATLLLEQSNVDEEFIRFSGYSQDADLTYSLVEEGDQASETLVGWLQIHVVDKAGTPQIADGVYFVPFYTLSA